VLMRKSFLMKHCKAMFIRHRHTSNLLPNSFG
jgi:hypothetical protein